MIETQKRLQALNKVEKIEAQEYAAKHLKNDYDKYRDQTHICDDHGHKDEPSFITGVAEKEPLEKFRHLKGLINNTYELKN